MAVAAVGTVAVVGADLVTKAFRPNTEHGGGWLRWFDSGLENNVPTYWTVVLLVLVSSACVVRRWWLPAAGVLAAACDEAFGWHEHLRAAGHVLQDHGVDLETHAWIIPGVVLALAVTAAALVWLRRVPPATRHQLQVALAVYAVGVLGVESLGGYINGHGASWRQAAYLTSLEEALEMAGVLLALRAVRAAPTSKLALPQIPRRRRLRRT